MTQEEKARAYDEALEDIRVIYPNLKGDARLAVEHASPELAESEDEKTRKELLSFIESVQHNYLCATDRRKKWIAYLEKQKINTEGDFGRGYNCGYEACLNSHGAEWFEKQKEQRPVNVDLDNASQDYVYNHFCSGADFTPDYIKGLMEDAFVDGANWQREPKPGTTKDNPINPFDTKVFQDGVKEGRRLEREEKQQN